MREPAAPSPARIGPPLTMAKPDPKKLIRRPRYRRIFGKRAPAWLVLEPNRLGLLGAAIFATLAMLYFGVRNAAGAQLPPRQVLVGVGITFVLSYAAVGIFVWYMLFVAEREFGPPALDEIQRSRLTKKREAAKESIQEMTAEEVVAALAESEPVPNADSEAEEQTEEP